MVDWELLSYMASVFMFMGTAFYFVILRPLAGEIAALEAAISDFRTTMRESERDRRTMDGRIGKLEESVRSAHKRTDRLEERVNLWEERRRE